MDLYKTRNVFFVEVREIAKMNFSKLPGAISKEELLENPSEYKDNKNVIYCIISYRSGMFAKKLEKKGIEVSNFPSGFLEWVNEGSKVLGQAVQPGFSCVRPEVELSPKRL